MMRTMSSGASSPTAASQVPRSPWHSPVPYLFGGLAAMLGLIAFALLILACSYWKLSGYLDDDNGGSRERDVEMGEANSDEKPKLPPVFEEKILVIMAGQEKPTFLATPISSRASSFGSNSSSSSSSGGSDSTEQSDDDRTEKEKPKQGSGDQVQTRSAETDETSEQIP